MSGTVGFVEAKLIRYRGRDGKGGLHWKFGYGEYLDGDCIRKARIATGIEEAVPLPLQSVNAFQL